MRVSVKLMRVAFKVDASDLLRLVGERAVESSDSTKPSPVPAEPRFKPPPICHLMRSFHAGSPLTAVMLERVAPGQSELTSTAQQTSGHGNGATGGELLQALLMPAVD